MKKILMCLFSFLFIGTALAGSAFLLAGCDTSYSQQEDGENSNDNGDNGETDNDAENDDNDNNDEIEAQGCDYEFTIIAQVVNSSGNVETATESTTYNMFYAYWEYNGSSQKYSPDSYKLNKNGTMDSASGKVEASYFNMVDTDGNPFVTHYRYLRIAPVEGYEIFGASTSSTGSYEASPMYPYIYGNKSNNNVAIGYSRPTDYSSVINKCTVYIKVRKKVTITFSEGGTSGISNMPSPITGYVGSYITLPTQKPSRTGYSFVGWAVSSEKTYYAGESYLNLPSLLYPQWRKNTYGYTINTTQYVSSRPSLNVGSSSSNASISKMETGAIVYHEYETSQIRITLSVSNSYRIYYNGSYVTSVTLYWTPRSSSSTTLTIYQRYTVTYYGNNNTGGSVPGQQSFYHGSSVTLSSNSLTRTGYSPNGWNTNSSGTGTNYSNGQRYATNSNLSLHAKWSPNTYVVAFNGNGSTSGSMSNQSFTYDQSKNLTKNAFSKTAYNFAGWATSANGGVVYSDGASVKNLATSGTVTLYAKWTPTTYTITFNGNGGSTPSSISYDTEDSTTLPSSTRSGFRFDGWKPNATSGNWSSGTTYASGTSVKGKYGNVTLYAQWTDNEGPTVSRVTWVQNGDYEYYAYAYVTDNVGVVRVQFPTWTELNGQDDIQSNWGTNSSASGTSGSWNVGGQTYNYRYLVRTSDHNNEYGMYHTHIYAYDAQGNSSVNSSNDVIDNIYLTWTISFNGNGASSPSSMTYTTANNKTLPSISRTGYTFNGWKPSSTSGGWSSGSTYGSGTSCNGKYGSVSMVAQWTAKQYTLTIKGNGGTPDTQVLPPKLIFDGGNCWNISGQLPTKTGYSIVGFFTSAGGGEQVYDANGVCINGTYWQDKKYKYDGDLTVYARWEAKNPAYYDEAGGYWYVENGMYPQSRATQTEINSIGSTNGASYLINGTTIVSKLGANNIEYCQYNGVWYKVEPIKWRLKANESQESGYGTTTATMAIMDTIVYADSFTLNKYIDLIGSTRFNGISDYVNLGRDYMFTDKITWSIWAYKDNWVEFAVDQADYINSERMISCTENGGWSIESKDGNVEFFIYDSSYGYRQISTNIAFSSLTGWNQFSLTFDGKTSKGYVNGELVGQVEHTGNLTYNSTNSIIIGAEPGSGDTIAGCYFNGLISDVIIVNEVLTQEEIKNLKRSFATDEVLKTMSTTYMSGIKGKVENFTENGKESFERTGQIFISSISEIENVAGDFCVKFSDLVSDILGFNQYFTRDLGSNLNNIKCFTELGMQTQRFATSVQGFQFTIMVSEYGCV